MINIGGQRLKIGSNWPLTGPYLQRLLYICQERGLPNRKQINRSQNLENYQPFHATQGTTIKSGYGLYVKTGLKFKSRSNLDLTYHDDKSGFQNPGLEF